jgi:hypothetical protein
MPAAEATPAGLAAPKKPARKLTPEQYAKKLAESQRKRRRRMKAEEAQRAAADVAKENRIADLERQLEAAKAAEAQAVAAAEQ